MAFIQQLPSLEAPSPLCHLARSEAKGRDRKFFSTEHRWGLGPTQEDENRFYSATTLARSAPLPFVISTEAKRSGEISVWMHLLGNVFRQSIDGPAGPPRRRKWLLFSKLPSLEAP